MKRVTLGPYLELACQRINLGADGDIFPNVLPGYAGVTRQRPRGGTQGRQRRLAAGQRLDGLRRGLLRVKFQEAALQHVLHLRRQGQGFAVEGSRVSRKLRFSMSSTCIVRDKGLGLIVYPPNQECTLQRVLYLQRQTIEPWPPEIRMRLAGTAGDMVRQTVLLAHTHETWGGSEASVHCMSSAASAQSTALLLAALAQPTKGRLHVVCPTARTCPTLLKSEQ